MIVKCSIIDAILKYVGCDRLSREKLSSSYFIIRSLHMLQCLSLKLMVFNAFLQTDLVVLPFGLKCYAYTKMSEFLKHTQ